MSRWMTGIALLLSFSAFYIGVAFLTPNIHEEEPAPDQTVPSVSSQSSSIGGMELDMPVDRSTKPFIKTCHINPGNTLISLLADEGVDLNEAQKAIQAFTQVYDPRRLKPGNELTLTFEDKDSLSLSELTLRVSIDKEITVTRKEDSYKAQTVKRRVHAIPRFQEGIIETTLYNAAVDADIPINILFDMIKLFSFDVDFQGDITNGNTFTVMYEDLLNEEGEKVREGDILYAVLRLRNREYRAYRFMTSDGKQDYYNTRGESVRKTLFRTPINGAHITSGYGMRKSPILGYSRFHPGIDFAAPEGTPIMASGDGIITFIGFNDVYGTYLKIRHANEYGTLYAHLSSYARGIARGGEVDQGDIIGFVGTTGMSTGPHLHYEVWFRGRQINPAAVDFPPGRVLKGEELKAFYREKNRLLWRAHLLAFPPTEPE